LQTRWVSSGAREGGREGGKEVGEVRGREEQGEEGWKEGRAARERVVEEGEDKEAKEA
jgi:hypothetical protein